MKKGIPVFLCFIMMCTMYISVVAEDNFKFIISPQIDSQNVAIKISYINNTEMCGGSFNFIYDGEHMEYIGYQESEEIKNTAYVVNETFRDTAIRMNWATSQCMTTSGDIITLSFKLKDGVFDKNNINIEKLKAANQNGGKIQTSFEVIAAPESSSETKQDEQINTSNQTVKRNSGTSVKISSGNSNSIDNDPEVHLLEFQDVTKADWFYEAVQFAYKKRITSGISDNQFAPNDKVTRGQFITMLCRAYSISEMTGDNFEDAGNTWYTGYLAAAKRLSISNGVGNNQFAPDKNITREEMVTLIYNYLKSIGEVSEDTTGANFADNVLISDWAKNAVSFASKNGIVKGKDNNVFDPQGNATRAELAQILFNLLNVE